MKASVVSLNAKYVHLSPAPYALGAGVLAFARQKHEVIVCDGTVGKGAEDALSHALAVAPDVLAFCVSIWNVEQIKALLPIARAALPHVPIILGGPEVSYAAEKAFLEMPEADYILSGEGEEPFARLLDALAEGTSVADVPGCAFRTENGVFVPLPFVGKGTPPSPLDFGYAEALRGRIAYLEGSRGCPFRCAFCLSGRVGEVRFFDLERIKRDVVRLAECGARTVKFVDRTFNANPSRAKELFRFLLARYGQTEREIRFHFEIAGELLDEETLSLLDTAPRGLFQMEIGIQSFNPRTLAAIRRSVHTDRLCEAVTRLVKMGKVHLHTDLIAGLPEEDLSSFRESFDRAFSLGAQMLQLGFLKLLHGAPMREEHEKFPLSYEKYAPYTVTQTPVLSEADLSQIKLVEEGCERLYNSRKYQRTLRAVLEDGRSPFDFFKEAGRAFLRLGEEYTLDTEMALWLSFFSAHLPQDRARDLLLWDFLSVNPSCYTPAPLRCEDAALARLKREADLRFPRRAGVRRAYAILYTEGLFAFADYGEKDPIDGTYFVNTIPLSDLKM